jgi:hypothetical protein
MGILTKINEKVLDELEFGFSCEKVIHQGWKEFEELKSKSKKTILLNSVKGLSETVLKQHFGKWQYIYRSEKGKISLIRIAIPTFDNLSKDR